MALKPLVKKQLSAWRPITARLILLRKLVSEFGLEGGSGLAADGIMSFIQVSCVKAVVGLCMIMYFRMARLSSVKT